MGNFVTNIVEKQIDPWNVNYPDTWPVIEKIWNIIFIIELFWNMYGSWYISTCVSRRTNPPPRRRAAAPPLYSPSCSR